MVVQYTGALIDLLRFRHGENVHSIHRMIEVEDWPQTTSQSPRNIGYCCFFDMSMILRSAHVMLGVLLWGKWGLFKPQGIQALKSSVVWCAGVARGVSWDYNVIVLQEGESWDWCDMMKYWKGGGVLRLWCDGVLSRIQRDEYRSQESIWRGRVVVLMLGTRYSSDWSLASLEQTWGSYLYMILGALSLQITAPQTSPVCSCNSH